MVFIKLESRCWEIKVGGRYKPSIIEVRISLRFVAFVNIL